MAKIKVYYQKRFCGDRFCADGNQNNHQTFIVCENAYDHKETLKEMGFRWDSMERSWVKKTSDESFMTELLKIVVSCSMTYDDFLNVFSHFIPESVQNASIEEDVLSAYNEYMDAHPEWF